MLFGLDGVEVGILIVFLTVLPATLGHAYVFSSGEISVIVADR